MHPEDISRVKYVSRTTLFSIEFFDFLNDVYKHLNSPWNSDEKQLIIDIAFEEWQKKKSESRTKISITDLLKQEAKDRSWYVPPECEGKKCHCCHFPATHQEYVNEYQGYRCFCSKHGAGCVQRMTKQRMHEIEVLQKVKEQPMLLFTEEERLKRGFYCQKCYAETGELIEIIKGTNICPRHGRV